MKNVDDTPEFYNGVRLKKGRDGSISRNQLTSLLNMGRSHPLEDIYQFIDDRIERRKKIGKKEEYAFWWRLVRILRDLKNVYASSLSAIGLSSEDEEVEAYLVRAYIEHFVAHCRYRTYKEENES